MKDKIREAMAKKVIAKYDEGVKEHGNKGLLEANLSIRDLMVEIQNEAIDTIAYTENVIQIIDRDREENKENE